MLRKFAWLGHSSANYMGSNRILLGLLRHAPPPIPPSTDTVGQARFINIYDIFLFRQAVFLAEKVSSSQKSPLFNRFIYLLFIIYPTNTFNYIYFYLVHMLLTLSNYNYYSFYLKIAQCYKTVTKKKQYISYFFHICVVTQS